MITENGSIDGKSYDPEKVEEITKDASANLKSFLDDFDFETELTKTNARSKLVEQTFVDNVSGDFIPCGIELNGWKVYESKNDDEMMALAKFSKKTVYIKTYNGLKVHKIDKFIVFPGRDDIIYFNTLNGRKNTKNIK